MSEFFDVTIISIFIILIEVTGIFFAIHVVMHPRSSQATIAWFIALILMPLITVPIYLLFGRTRFNGYAEAIHAKQESIQVHWKDWYAKMIAMGASEDPKTSAIGAVVTRLSRIPFTRGNEVVLLIDAKATYDAMLLSIAEAKKYIFVQFYIVRDDKSGRKFRDALIKKTKEGVRVYFLYDEIGCIQLTTSYFDVMRNASIEVTGFKTTKGHNNRFQVNFRNHRKLLIVDGKSSFIGGHNLGDEYLKFRDTHMKIIGPASQQIQLSFLVDWYWATGKIPAISQQIESSDRENNSVAIISTGPADNGAHCSILFCSLINMAKNRLWITSPYFVPDAALVRSLQAAALRGVDVRIILPAKADKKFIEFASFTYYNNMLKCGIRLFRYRHRFLHQKVIIVDDEIAGIGTVNFDNRSMYLNFEVTGLVSNQNFVNQVAVMLEKDLANSDEVENTHFDEKPLIFQVAARVSRLASPLL